MQWFYVSGSHENVFNNDFLIKYYKLNWYIYCLILSLQNKCAHIVDLINCLFFKYKISV